MGQEEKGRGSAHVALVNWDGVEALRGRAWPSHCPIREPDNISAQRPSRWMMWVNDTYDTVVQTHTDVVLDSDNVGQLRVVRTRRIIFGLVLPVIDVIFELQIC